MAKSSVGTMIMNSESPLLSDFCGCSTYVGAGTGSGLGPARLQLD